MPKTRQLAAIMFTDIVGYTALMGNDEQKAFEILNKNRELQRPIIEKYNGRWIKELGDGVMASFNTVSDAVYAAIEIQKQCIQSCNFSLRIGIHQGEIVLEGEDVFGDVVNIAARIQTIAHIGSIFISDTVHHDIANKPDIQTKFAKTEKLKNVREPVRIYQVIIEKSKKSTNTLSAQSKNLIKKTVRIPFRTIAFTVFIITALLLLILYYTNKGDGLFGKAGIKTIAVLPFTNESGNAEMDYLSDGMTETLISLLSQINNLKVKARTSVFRYKGKDVSINKVGSELNVQAILSGRIIQRDNNLMLSLWLVDTRTEEDLWSKQYNRNISNLLMLQSEIATDVADNLKNKLSGEDKKQLAKNFTENEEAYQLYLKGLYFWNKRTAEDIRKSIAYFTEATEKDPSFAKAYAWLASAYLVLTGYTRNLTKQQLKDIDLKMRSALARAKELDNSLPEVHLISGSLYEDEWNFTAAEKELKHAIRLNPNFASAHQWYSILLTKMGRMEEGWEEINKAYELDPFSISINFSIGGQYYYALQFDNAISHLKKVLEMEPDHPLSNHILGLSYEAKGMYLEAIDQFQKSDVLLEKTSDSTAKYTAELLRQAVKKNGAQGYWKKQLELSISDNKKGIGSHFKIAINYARLGDTKNAIAELEQSITAREPDITWLKIEPAFRSIHNDQRFKNLFHKVGLPV